jgi:urate oxidase
MSAVLVHDAYGKSLVRLTRVTRHADRHDLKELTIDVQLEGDFAAAYTHGDNSRVIATDTMKNTVYALAKGHSLTDIESFSLALTRHFLDNNAHVTSARVHAVEHA